MLYKIDKIREIPMVIVNDHHHVYKFWRECGMKDADVLHVDAHEDMGDIGVYENGTASLDYYKKLNIGNFLIAAFHNRIISSIYWLNPHSEKRQLQDMGCREGDREGKNGRAYLETEIANSKYKRVRWIRGLPKSTFVEHGKIIKPADLEWNSPRILDIDLDAFCCNAGVRNVPMGIRYDGVSGFENRVDQMIDLLERQGRPDIISIARSFSHNLLYNFVPHEKIEDVQKEVLEKLRKLYG